MFAVCCLFEWNSIRLSGLSDHAHGIATKTVHKTLPGGGGCQGEGGGEGVVRVRGWWGRGQGGR